MAILPNIIVSLAGIGEAVASFWDGSVAYNITLFWLAVGSVVIGGGGFLWIIVQVYKTKSAASAASDRKSVV